MGGVPLKSPRTYITVALASMAVFALLRRFSSTSTTLTRIMAALTIPLNDGKQIPWLGFGTGTALYQRDAEAAVRVAIANGIVHLDGAQMYQNEDSLGNAIASSGKPRAELFVTTKLGKLPEGKTVRDTLLDSLKKLKLDEEKHGFPITALREINALMVCKHENVVGIREVVVGDTLTQ